EPSHATITIKDDETPVVSVTATDPAAGESGTGEGTAEFKFTRLGLAKNELAVAFAVGGTAVEGEDFVPIGRTVVLPAGASSATLLVSPIDDAVWEEDKTLVLTLQAGAGYTVGSPDTATVAIKNDDPLILPVVTVTAADSTADENGGKGVFVFRRAESIGAELTVNIEVGGTAAPETDYVALGNTVTFPAGATEIVKVVEPINNETVDGDRTVVVTLKPDASYNVASPDSATVTIMDDDVPIVTVWAVDDTASEYGPGTAVFRFGRAGSLVDPLTVQFSVTGTAQAGVDYVDIGQSVTFPAGANTVSVVVIPIDDDEVEGDETVTVTILEGGVYDERFASPATVRILDNDVELGFGDGGLHLATATTGRAGLAAASQVRDSDLVDGKAILENASGQNGAHLLSLGLLSAPVVQVQAGYLVLTYERVTPNPGFEYLIEVSRDLINWEPAGSNVREIVTQPAEGREVVEAYYLEPLAGGDARFLRLRVVASEQRASW
ncbi:MAG TPA: Calx-beta domain-containing protein, partial [Verrucomicrobiota bacterium]|nr:Calx-beta domain-containing protein [Verrucomicrobiota bacterium]